VVSSGFWFCSCSTRSVRKSLLEKLEELDEDVDDEEVVALVEARDETELMLMANLDRCPPRSPEAGVSWRRRWGGVSPETVGTGKSGAENARQTQRKPWKIRR
jgi:hypothetical protein